MRHLLRAIVLVLLLGGLGCAGSGPTDQGNDVLIPPPATGQPSGPSAGPPEDYIPLGPDGKPVGGWKPNPN